MSQATQRSLSLREVTPAFAQLGAPSAQVRDPVKLVKSHHPLLCFQLGLMARVTRSVQMAHSKVEADAWNAVKSAPRATV